MTGAVLGANLPTPRSLGGHGGRNDRQSIWCRARSPDRFGPLSARSLRVHRGASPSTTAPNQETNMPVSTKRKKDGKPVRRAQPALPADTGEGASAGSHGAEQPKIERRIGKPRNPFVERQGHKASQRGR